MARQNCRSCHGNNDRPLFATADAVSSYAALFNASKIYVDLSQPSGSRLVTYAGNGHCGAAGLCGTNTVRDQMSQAVQTFAADVADAQEQACQSP